MLIPQIAHGLYIFDEGSQYPVSAHFIPQSIISLPTSVLIYWDFHEISNPSEQEVSVNLQSNPFSPNYDAAFTGHAGAISV